MSQDGLGRASLLVRGVRLWAALLARRPGTITLSMLALAALSTWAATKLTINTNQLDLISQDLRQVKDVKRVVDMVGGAGHLILALRGKDETVLKAVADDLAVDLAADRANVRHLSYKVPTEFVRKKAALFMKTEDLVEVRRRVSEKLRDVIKRANPFYFEIKKTEPKKLEIDDILARYKRVGKKSIVDDYYISDDRELVLLLLKPNWDSNEIARTGRYLDTLRQTFARYDRENARGVRLREDYSRDLAPDARAVEYGFTGTYTTNYDDSNEIVASLGPVSGVSFVGVVGVLALFFRRRLWGVPLIVSGLVLGVACTFGVAYVAVGQLNMITGILAGILMGQGIDFGVHLLYRLRVWLDAGWPFPKAVLHTMETAGVAALVSAAGTGAAFLSLVFSEFRGFSQFGVLAGVGIFIIGGVMFTWVPAVLLWLERARPGLPARLLGRAAPGADGPTPPTDRRIPRPGLLLLVSSGLALLVVAFAPRVSFEYNTRALMVENQPSVMLQDEVNARFQISSDPVAVYTPTIEDARKIHQLLVPLDPARFSTVDQVVSMFSFVPDAEQQKRNAAVLGEWRSELSSIDRAMLPAEYESQWDEAMSYLTAEPYALNEVPPRYRDMFTHLSTTRPENHGFLSFIYPVVDLWDGRQMLRFADEVENLTTSDGKTWHAAGLPILYAKLARIVLWDGKFTVALTAVLLLVILLWDLRSLRSTAAALLPLVGGIGVMLGAMTLLGTQLNFMNIVVLPIVLGYGISHGVYLIHRSNEGVSPIEALRNVGAAVAASTFTTLAGWAALLTAGHRGLKSMGTLACLGMTATLLVSFTVMPAVLQILYDRRSRRAEPRAA